MEDQQRPTKIATIINPDEYQENGLEVSIIEEADDGDKYSPNPQNKPRSRAALSFMEVNSIVAASFGENERRCYKVHWKDSWIYEDHLFGCEEIIEEFWKEQEKNEKQMQKLSMSGENGILTNSKKDGGNNISNNTELTVIVVSKDTESEVSVTDEADNGEQNMIPDWLIAREASDANMKENEMTWKDDVMDVKGRIIPKRRHVINVREATDDSKENQVIWDNEDMEMKGNIVHKKRNMLTCHICGDNFDMVSAIRRHYTTNHPGNKPFACDSCGKRFDRKENLNRHIRIHTGDRRYVCNHCGKGYTDPSGLKKHVLSKHSNLVFPCQFCKATFKSKDSMNRHLTKHLQDYKAQKEEGFDVGSKRPLFDDDTDNSKVFLQSSTSHITTKDITQAISEAGGVSDHENSNISPIQNSRETFNDSEAIEVQFIHLSQEEGMPIQSEEDKIKSSVENGEYSGPPSAHAQYVVPITTEQILKLTSDAKSVPIIAEHLNNIPITEENLKKLSFTSEHLKNLQITEEHTKNVPISTEDLKNILMTQEHLKHLPITIEHLKNLPITEEHLKTLPITTDNLKNIPITEEHLKNIPIIAEHLKNIPITEEHLKSLAITAEQIGNLPIRADQLKPLPITTEQLKSMSTEQFMSSIASTEQLIAVSVVSPQRFTYPNNGKLTSSLPTHSTCDMNLAKD